MGSSNWSIVDQPRNLLTLKPVVLITVGNKEKSQIFSLEWTLSLKESESLLSIVLNKNHFAFALLEETGEFGINIADTSIATAVLSCNRYPEDSTEDKFSSLGLTRVYGEIIKTPLIAEAAAVIECRVNQIHTARPSSLIIAKMVAARADRDHFHNNQWRLEDGFRMIHHVDGIHYFSSQP